MSFLMMDAMTVLSGLVVGLVLGTVGGGGSILAVPLLVYLVGVSPHVAVGTSAVAVAASAMFGFMSHAREQTVKWRCALVFAAAGVVGVLGGAAVAKRFDGQALLALFGGLMIVVGLAMLRHRKSGGDPLVRLTRGTAGQLLPMLIPIGLVIGLLAGFFGIGGGFLIVPGLMFATGMPLRNAIGTSLVAVSAFGLATAGSYAASSLVDWQIAGFFVAGGLLGGIAGTRMGRGFNARGALLSTGFAALVILVGLYVGIRGLGALGFLQA